MGAKSVVLEDPVRVRPFALRPPARLPSRLSRRERRKLATREALIQAAQEVIAVKGVYVAAIEEITERADVAKGSFYQYFRDRDDLLQVLLTRRLEELRIQIEAIPPPRTFARRVRVLLHLHLAYFLRHEDFLLFLHQIRGLIKLRQDVTPVIRETYEGYLRFVAHWLNPPRAQSRSGKKAGEEGACALLGFLTGLLAHAAILSPLTNLSCEQERLETALAAACVAFWKQ